MSNITNDLFIEGLFDRLNQCVKWATLEDIYKFESLIQHGYLEDAEEVIWELESRAKTYEGVRFTEDGLIDASDPDEPDVPTEIKVDYLDDKGDKVIVRKVPRN